MKKLILPKQNATEEIETSQSLLFIGANGSGKTRLGSWVEINSPQKNLVHRISAQKSLALPDSTTPQSIEQAEKDLLFGNPQWSYQHKSNKWGNKPATQFLNDYQKLMVYLFSDETEENAKFKRECKTSSERVEPPVTKIDRVKELWEEILPHRELIIGGLRIQTRVKGQEDKIYNSSEMSDGERVIFYLIGQCLAAPKDGIIVIKHNRGQSKTIPPCHINKSPSRKTGAFLSLSCYGYLSIPFLAVQTNQALQAGTDVQKASVADFHQGAYPGDGGQAGQPAPAGEAGPEGDEGIGTALQLALAVDDAKYMDRHDLKSELQMNCLVCYSGDSRDHAVIARLWNKKLPIRRSKWACCIFWQ